MKFADSTFGINSQLPAELVEPASDRVCKPGVVDGQKFKELSVVVPRNSVPGVQSKTEMQFFPADNKFGLCIIQVYSRFLWRPVTQVVGAHLRVHKNPVEQVGVKNQAASADAHVEIAVLLNSVDIGVVPDVPRPNLVDHYHSGIRTFVAGKIKP